MWAELVVGSIDEYNLTVVAAQDFIDQMREEIQTYYEERSSSWQKSDHGTSFNSFLEQWDISLEEIDLDSPTETDVPDFEAVGQLDSLPVEPD